MEHSPRGQPGILRMIVAIIYWPIMRQILCHLKLTADPPPITLPQLNQARFAWASR